MAHINRLDRSFEPFEEFEKFVMETISILRFMIWVFVVASMVLLPIALFVWLAPDIFHLQRQHGHQQRQPQQRQHQQHRRQAPLHPQQAIFVPPQPASTTMLASHGHPLREEDTDCTICFDPLLDTEHTVTHDLCFHSFHRKCVQQWIGRMSPHHPTCPLCNSTFERQLPRTTRLPRSRRVRMQRDKPEDQAQAQAQAQVITSSENLRAPKSRARRVNTRYSLRQ